MSTPTETPEHPSDSKPKKPRNVGRRFRILIGVVIAIIVIYSAAWFAGAAYVKSTLGDTLTALATPATQIDCADISVWGFPFRYDVTCSNAQFQDGDVVVAVPEIKATVLIYRPTHVQLFAQSPATYTDAFTGSQNEIGWDSLRASARSNGWSLSRVSVEGEALTLSDTLVGSTELGRFGHIEAHVLDNPDQFDAETNLTELAIYARIEQADLNALGISDGALVLEAEVPGVPHDMRDWNRSTLMANWQNRPIRIVNLHADDPASSIDVVGQISTDAEALLNGDFDLTTDNVYEPLSETIAPQMLDMFLGQKNNDGTRYRSYSIRHGVLMAGNLPFYQIQ